MESREQQHSPKRLDSRTGGVNEASMAVDLQSLVLDYGNRVPQLRKYLSNFYTVMQLSVSARSDADWLRAFVSKVEASGTRLLLGAVHADDAARVRQLVAASADINAPRDDYSRPLMVAVIEGKCSAMAALVEVEQLDLLRFVSMLASQFTKYHPSTQPTITGTRSLMSHPRFVAAFDTLSTITVATLAAGVGDIQLLERLPKMPWAPPSPWAPHVDRRWESAAWTAAEENSDLTTLQWLHEHMETLFVPRFAFWRYDRVRDTPADPGTRAINVGDVSVLRWMVDNGYIPTHTWLKRRGVPLPPDTRQRYSQVVDDNAKQLWLEAGLSPSGARREVLEFLRETFDGNWHPAAMTGVVRCGNSEEDVRWLLGRGCPYYGGALQITLDDQDLSMMDLLLTHDNTIVVDDAWYCESAVGSGYVDGIALLRKHNARWSRRCTIRTIFAEDLATATYLIEAGCPLGTAESPFEAIRCAAFHALVDFVRLCAARHPDLNSSAVAAAALSPNSDEWARAYLTGADINVIAELREANASPAKDQSRIDILRFLHDERGMPFEAEHMALAVSECNVSVVRYLRECGCAWPEDVLPTAVINDDVDLLRLMQAGGYPWDVRVCEAVDTEVHSRDNGAEMKVAQYLRSLAMCPCGRALHRQA